jgi:hypothetical protein
MSSLAARKNEEEHGRVGQTAKVFCFFFSKKKAFLPPLITANHAA